MQFLVIGYDGTDAEALERRLKVREEHLAKIGELKKRGECLVGGAILDDNGKMKGSMLVYELPDREALEERLKDEPYFTKGIWQKVEIQPFRMAII